jgi:hypothetical protein
MHHMTKIPPNYRPDINPAADTHELIRALFYAICDECDKARIELRPEHVSSVTAFALVLFAIETARAGLKNGTGETGKLTLSLFENFAIALGRASDYGLPVSALSNLILLTDEDAVKMQKELWELGENNQKLH